MSNFVVNIVVADGAAQAVYSSLYLLMPWHSYIARTSAVSMMTKLWSARSVKELLITMIIYLIYYEYSCYINSLPSSDA